MFCCTLLYVLSSIAIILMVKNELVALLNFSSWCLMMVERLFVAAPCGCLLFVIVVFPDHTHLLFCMIAEILSELIINSDFFSFVGVWTYNERRALAIIQPITGPLCAPQSPSLSPNCYSLISISPCISAASLLS